MSNTTPKPHANGLSLLKIALYFLSGLVLVVGLAAGASLIASASHTAANLLLPLQLIGNEAIANLLSGMLTGFITNLGVFTLIVTICLSALLFGVGRLVGRILRLESRLARLEKSG